MSDWADQSWFTQMSPTYQGSGLEIKVNPAYSSQVAGRLEPWKAFPNTLRPALVKVAEYVRLQMIPRTFKAEGPKWPALALRTQRDRKAAGYGAEHPILIRTGDLFQELVNKSHPKHVEIIKVGKNSRIIVGGSSKKFTDNQEGNEQLNLPARPMIPGTGYVPVGSRDSQNINAILKSEIKRALADSSKARGGL